MPPNISIRDSIRWLPDLASEPTSTLVLTSGHNRFVDTRILHASPTENAGSNWDGYSREEDVLPFSRLDWAFAGTSESHRVPCEPQVTDVAPGAEEGEARQRFELRSTWHHWVDSRYVEADGVVDTGVMVPLADGRTLESGSMVGPDSGEVRQYEEVWRDVDAEGEVGERVCAVLLLERDMEGEDKARGMIVRVGGFCQGVLRIGADIFCLERWEVVNGSWKRQFRVGDSFMPCGMATATGPSIELGAKVRLGEMEWKVVELSNF